LEPEVAAALEAIDATLAGDPVDPAHAELAELALILSDERPAVDLETARSLDEKVTAFRTGRPPRERRRPRVRLGWIAGPIAGLAAVALVVVVVSAPHHNGSGVQDLSGGGAATFGAATTAASSSASAGATAPSAGSDGSGASSGGDSSGGGSSGSAASSATRKAAAPSHSVPEAPAPSSSGPGKRQVVQSAQLSLSAAPRKIDDVAQQVFDVVDSEQGIVSSSHVTSTGGLDGSARFALSIPVTHLQRTVSELSQLQGARVLSRTDDTTDITGQVGGAGRRLAEARALRRSLLRQLAAATTSDAIASLKARLRAANAAIDRDASTLDGLHKQVDYSDLTVTIQASAVPITTSKHSSGFTLHRAAHDAGRVLVVVAGVALIALAVLVPLVLLVAIVAWLWLALRRRRREAMLDLV
jgi:hypothetical protein